MVATYGKFSMSVASAENNVSAMNKLKSDAEFDLSIRQSNLEWAKSISMVVSHLALEYYECEDDPQRAERIEQAINTIVEECINE